MTKRRAATIMIQGTASDVGKSILATALCRIFTQDGLRTAPFKSQNMSNNAYVTWDGKEIGRAQGMQADACRIPATTDMNPILLKPSGMMSSQVVVHGVPLREYDARAYREHYLAEAEPIVREALERLRAAHDVVVLEGAGSPAEINLKDRDIVNMRMAGWADAPVLLAADIDRGGVFASIVGTMDILEPHERDRVAGFVINKFRGDVTLLQPGLDWLEARTGKPVLGVIPYLPNLGLEDEDSLSLDRRSKPAGSDGSETGEDGGDKLDIAVLRLPRIANFTDFDPLHAEADVTVRYVTTAEQLGRPDAVIIPGSKNVAEDLEHLRASGIAVRLELFQQAGGRIVGICGGYEMMGRVLRDPERVESGHEVMDGFGWLPMAVTFGQRKRTVRVAGHGALPGLEGSHPLIGYEIHMGRVELEDEGCVRPFRVHAAVEGSGEALLEEPYAEGAASNDGRLWGTFMHGIMHNDSFRRAWLNSVRQDRGWPALPCEVHVQAQREAAFDRLADHVRVHLDMTRLKALLEKQRTREEEDV